MKSSKYQLAKESAKGSYNTGQSYQGDPYDVKTTWKLKIRFKTY